MIIARLLSPSPLVGFWHHQLYSDLGADTVMQSTTLIDPDGSRASRRSVLSGGRWIVLPEVLKRFGKRPLLYRSVNVPGVAGKYKLVMIALSGEYLSHMLVGENPIV